MSINRKRREKGISNRIKAFVKKAEEYVEV
jgi:hypothetical protein